MYPTSSPGIILSFRLKSDLYIERNKNICRLKKNKFKSKRHHKPWEQGWSVPSNFDPRATWLSPKNDELALGHMVELWVVIGFCNIDCMKNILARVRDCVTSTNHGYLRAMQCRSNGMSKATMSWRSGNNPTSSLFHRTFISKKMKIDRRIMRELTYLRGNQFTIVWTPSS